MSSSKSLAQCPRAVKSSMPVSNHTLLSSHTCSISQAMRGKYPLHS